MALQGLGWAFSPSRSKAVLQALHMDFGLQQVLFESLLELGMVGGLRHLGQRADELRFGVKQILQLFDK